MEEVAAEAAVEWKVWVARQKRKSRFAGRLASRVRSQSWARRTTVKTMGPLGKIASFFKNVPLENNRSSNNKGKAYVYNNVSAWNKGTAFRRHTPGWTSLRLPHGVKGEWPIDIGEVTGTDTFGCDQQQDASCLVRFQSKQPLQSVAFIMHSAAQLAVFRIERTK
jgi:hypothetical protein